MMQNDAKYHTIQLNTTKITNIAQKYTPKYHKTPTNNTKHHKILQKCHKIPINTTKYPTLSQNSSKIPQINTKYHKLT